MLNPPTYKCPVCGKTFEPTGGMGIQEKRCPVLHLEMLKDIRELHPKKDNLQRGNQKPYAVGKRIGDTL